CANKQELCSWNNQSCWHEDFGSISPSDNQHWRRSTITDHEKEGCTFGFAQIGIVNKECAANQRIVDIWQYTRQTCHPILIDSNSKHWRKAQSFAGVSASTASIACATVSS